MIIIIIRIIIIIIIYSFDLFMTSFSLRWLTSLLVPGVWIVISGTSLTETSEILRIIALYSSSTKLKIHLLVSNVQKPKTWYNINITRVMEMIRYSICEQHRYARSLARTCAVRLYKQ